MAGRLNDSADDYILELLRHAGIAADPNTIGFNVDYDRRYVSERCWKLAEEGLLERMDEGKAMYRIAEKGRKYLAGELDADELEGEGG